MARNTASADAEQTTEHPAADLDTIVVEAERNAEELVREEVGFANDSATNVEYVGGREVGVTPTGDNAFWRPSEFDSIRASPWKITGVMNGGVRLTRE